MSKKSYIKPAKHIETLKPYKSSEAFRMQLRNDVFRYTHHKYIAKLDYNESSFPPSPKVSRAVKKIASSYPLNWYPDPDYLELKQELEKHYQNKIKQKNILITNGSCEALGVIAKAFCNSNNEVLIISPTYDYIRYSAERDNIKVKKFFLDGKFNFNFSEFKKAITKKTKVVYLVNPNNPTGTVYSRKQIIEIANFLQRKRIILIVDEAYIEYTNFSSVVPLVNKLSNLIVTRTFSKAYGLANFRVGYLVSDEKNIAWIDKLIPDFPINTFGEKAAATALRDQKYLSKIVKRTTKNREYLIKKLNEKGYKTYSGPVSYLLVQVDDVDKATKTLADNNIVVRPKKHLPPLDNFIRITVGKLSDCKKIISLL